jgi:hypothetical protein
VRRESNRQQPQHQDQSDGRPDSHADPERRELKEAVGALRRRVHELEHQLAVRDRELQAQTARAKR